MKSEKWTCLWEEMAYVSSFWLHWGMLCSGLAVVFAEDCLWDCADRDDILREAPANVSTPTDCTLDCTVRTYRVVLELQKKHSIRFKDSHPGQIYSHTHLFIHLRSDYFFLCSASEIRLFNSSANLLHTALCFKHTL